MTIVGEATAVMQPASSASPAGPIIFNNTTPYPSAYPLNEREPTLTQRT